MSVCMFSGLFVVTAFADENGQYDDYRNLENDGTKVEKSKSSATVNTGLADDTDGESVEEQLAYIETSDLTEEEKVIAIEKLLDVDKENEIMPRDTTWNHLSGFGIWKQSESYYCVPASVKAAMHYLTGNSDAQDVIAKALKTTTSGTQFSEARTYLNNNQSKNNYLSKPSTTTLASMKNNFSSAIKTYDAPPLISVKLSTSSGWAYNTSGHCMLISGARNDKEQFRIADPYLQWVDSNGDMYYSKTASEIHTAIVDRGNGYIY